MFNSRYSLIHAISATALLLIAVFSQGFAAFWKQFVHGLNLQMTPKALLVNFACTAVLFGTLALVLWASTLFAARPSSPAKTRLDRWAAIRLAARWSPLVIAIALGLNWLCTSCIEWLFGIQPSDQELVKCLAGDACPLGIRLVLGLLVLLEAPLLEEPLFRGIIFRGFAARMPVWAAMGLSGFVFALVHVNAASFVPLWFLSVAFAVLYRHTGTILAPMTTHALFNAANLALLPFLS